MALVVVLLVKSVVHVVLDAVEVIWDVVVVVVGEVNVVADEVDFESLNNIIGSYSSILHNLILSCCKNSSKVLEPTPTSPVADQVKLEELDLHCIVKFQFPQSCRFAP